MVILEIVIEIKGLMKVYGYMIGEFENKNYGKFLVIDIIVKSLNCGIGCIVFDVGVEC